jgi:membrane protein DedA with SNARE-associated domain
MPDIQSILDELRDAYTTWGYPVVFLGALLENTALLGLFLPGGTLVLLGAIYAQQGTMALPLVLLLGCVGMVAGTSLDYALGRWGVPSALGRTRLFLKLRPRLDEAERFLDRRGVGAFLLAHFIGHVRSFLAITAGTSRLPYRRFLLYEGVAALAWNLVFVGAGYLLGENIELLQRLAGGMGLAAFLLAVACYAMYRLVRRTRAADSPIR